IPITAPTPAPPGGQGPQPTTAIIDATPPNPSDLAAIRAALRAAAESQLAILQASIAANSTLRPAATPPSALTITIGESARPSTGGVRVSGVIGSREKRRLYISGKPGTRFSDGTFEFQGVQPGRHLIASVGNSNPFASVVVVGDQD